MCETAQRLSLRPHPRHRALSKLTSKPLGSVREKTAFATLMNDFMWRAVRCNVIARMPFTKDAHQVALKARLADMSVDLKVSVWLAPVDKFAILKLVMIFWKYRTKQVQNKAVIRSGVV